MFKRLRLAALFFVLAGGLCISPAFAQLTESVWICEPKVIQRGTASVYSSSFDRRDSYTANGDAYNGLLLTAAHPALKFGTILEVEDLKTRKKIFVRVNDRGPYVKNRIIDLTPAGRKGLGHDKDGLYKVSLRVCHLNESVMKTAVAAARNAKPLLTPRPKPKPKF